MAVLEDRRVFMTSHVAAAAPCKLPKCVVGTGAVIITRTSQDGTIVSFRCGKNNTECLIARSLARPSTSFRPSPSRPPFVYFDRQIWDGIGPSRS